jgi:hypothetical protein
MSLGDIVSMDGEPCISYSSFNCGLPVCASVWRVEQLVWCLVAGYGSVLSVPAVWFNSHV